jgi:hypothetical protein
MVGRDVDPGQTFRQGAFRFELERLVLDHNFTRPAENRTICALQLNFAFEPKIEPILIVLHPRDFIARDDRDRKFTMVGEEPVEATLGPEKFQFPLSIRLNAPDREAKKLAKVDALFQVHFPSRMEKFEIPLSTSKPGVSATSSLRVSVDKVENDEGRWVIGVLTEDLLHDAGIDSNARATLETRVELVNAEGKVFEHNGGLSSTVSEETKRGFEYIFVDAPGKVEDWKLRLIVPVGITRVPINVQLKDIPLP